MPMQMQIHKRTAEMLLLTLLIREFVMWNRLLERSVIFIIMFATKFKYAGCATMPAKNSKVNTSYYLCSSLLLKGMHYMNINQIY